jgi:Tfp pilus assembly PilM family ATPase
MRKEINVLYIHNGFIELAQVAVAKTVSIQKKFRVSFDDTNINEALFQLMAKVKSKKVYLLLGQEYCYVVNFSIPSHILLSEERNFVYKRISESVPEIITEKDWDFKVITKNNDEKKILAFAFVKNKFELIRKAIEKIEVEVVAIEPEEISVLRNSNPVIGVAIKNDIYGNDESVLNINLNNFKVRKINYKLFIYLILPILLVVLFFYLT